MQEDFLLETPTELIPPLPAGDTSCYSSKNVGTIGPSGTNCANMLIVDNQLLRKIVSSGGKMIVNGNTYTLENSKYNIFTGQVTDMSGLFRNNKIFNGDISYWDVSNVVNFDFMFTNSVFDRDLRKWNVQSAESFNTFHTNIEWRNKFGPNFKKSKSLQKLCTNEQTIASIVFALNDANSIMDGFTIYHSICVSDDLIKG